MLSGNVCFSLIFIPLFCMKKYFIGSKSQIVPGAVVYLSALGNTLVWLQQLELQREGRQSDGRETAKPACFSRFGGEEMYVITDKETEGNLIKA